MVLHTFYASNFYNKCICAHLHAYTRAHTCIFLDSPLVSVARIRELQVRGSLCAGSADSPSHAIPTAPRPYPCHRLPLKYLSEPLPDQVAAICAQVETTALIDQPTSLTLFEMPFCLLGLLSGISQHTLRSGHRGDPGEAQPFVAFVGHSKSLGVCVSPRGPRVSHKGRQDAEQGERRSAQDALVLPLLRCSFQPAWGPSAPAQPPPLRLSLCVVLFL